MTDKKELRRALRELRDSIEEKNRLVFSERICNSCLSLPEYKNADTVLLYFASGSEADLVILAKNALAAGKIVGYPRVEGKGQMSFYRVFSLSQLEAGYYGIREPKNDAPPCPIAGAVCFVPAIAFDKRGYRLGYGGGFYDRFLENFKGVSVGITYEETLHECLPTETHDKKTDYIITEKRVNKTIEG